jgi:hypothetical protein
MNGFSNDQSMFDVQIEDAPVIVHAYESFKRKLFECLDYRKSDAATSLHKLFRFIEKTVTVLGKAIFSLLFSIHSLSDSENVFYRCLVVFKALIDCSEKPNAYEFEYLRVHLCDTLTNETAQSLAKGLFYIKVLSILLFSCLLRSSDRRNETFPRECDTLLERSATESNKQFRSATLESTSEHVRIGIAVYFR